MTALDLAMRLVGEVAEMPGAASHPGIIWFHQMTTLRATDDDVAWCSSFCNWVAWLLRLPRSKSAAARSWLEVGASVLLSEARPGWDVVIFSRGASPTAGHVAFFSGLDGDRVRVCGGNQGNAVSVASFPASSVLGVRRLKAV